MFGYFDPINIFLIITKYFFRGDLTRTSFLNWRDDAYTQHELFDNNRSKIYNECDKNMSISFGTLPK